MLCALAATEIFGARGFSLPRNGAENPFFFVAAITKWLRFGLTTRTPPIFFASFNSHSKWFFLSNMGSGHFRPLEFKRNYESYF
jgi:hypothetical protein